MELKDFYRKSREQIKEGLSTLSLAIRKRG